MASHFFLPSCVAVVESSHTVKIQSIWFVLLAPWNDTASHTTNIPKRLKRSRRNSSHKFRTMSSADNHCIIAERMAGNFYFIQSDGTKQTMAVKLH